MSTVRIISGTARGKKLAGLTGGTIRPTPDRVREAVFSILFSRLGGLEGQKVLDLFAGSGALGLEALSRGAARAVLVDSGRQAAAVLPANVAACAMEDKASFLRADALRILPELQREGPFDLIFLDPPYGRDLVPLTVAGIDAHGLLAAGGLLCAESAPTDEVPARLGGLLRVERRSYGSTTIHLFTHDDAEKTEP